MNPARSRRIVLRAMTINVPGPGPSVTPTPTLATNQPRLGFECPLRRRCLGGGTPFGSFHAANRAAGRYHACGCPDTREALAAELYGRFAPLVRKTLARFCGISRCYPGGCVPEDLIGESYLAFHQALERFDPAFGVDFVGYLSQRLYWALEHRVRDLGRRLVAQHEPDDVRASEEEDVALTRVAAAEMFGRVTAVEAELLMQEAAGHTDRELASAAGVTPAAIRKRLERLRRRLRQGQRGG